MPKLRLAASVPAIDWKSRSTGAPASRQASWVVMWARQQAWVGIAKYVDQPVQALEDRARRPSTDSAAGLTPITASPQPKSRPSAAESRMPARSSLGWLGWIRMPRTPRSPIVLRHRVTTRILLAARTRSLLLISFATAAAISGVSPADAAARCSPVVASSRIHSRNSPTVRWPSDRRSLLVELVEDQPAHLVDIGIDEGMVDDLLERDIRQDELGRDTLALGRAARPAS